MKPPDLTADLVRAAYPKAVKCVPGTAASGRYCVGGALCRFIGYQYGDPYFPEPTQLAGALMQANPALTMQKARYCSSVIVELNDASDFSEAWSALDFALTWTPPAIRYARGRK